MDYTDNLSRSTMHLTYVVAVVTVSVVSLSVYPKFLICLSKGWATKTNSIYNYFCIPEDPSSFVFLYPNILEI